MVIPFANTKLRLPKGFQSLVVGLSTEVLRNQPKNINEFAAQYFERLLQRREQGQSYLPGKQTSLEDRYYNNQSFEEEYSVNDAGANSAATKIQAQFRGHKARRDLQKIKGKNKQIVDTDQQELGYGHEQSSTSNEVEKSSPLPSAHSQEKEDENEEVSFKEELTEEEKREQQRAAVAIQAKFRGYQVRKNLPKSSSTTSEHEQLSDHQQQQQDFENIDDKTPSPLSIHSSEKMNSDLSGNSTTHGAIEAGENNDLEREGTQLSEDSERHTKLPLDPDFNREQRPESFEFENDMSDPNLDKAATRIQASFRGYKIRKELGTGLGNRSDDQQPSSNSPQTHDEYDNARNKNILSPSAEGNKEPIVEENDNAAAVKIQAAYRGYRVRKDLEK